MKKSNIVKNVINILVMIIVILIIFFLAKRENAKEIIQIEKISEQTETIQELEYARKTVELTSRHSISKNRSNINFQETIEEQETVKEESKDLSKLTVAELKALASEKNITVPAGAKKAEILGLLK